MKRCGRITALFFFTMVAAVPGPAAGEDGEGDGVAVAIVSMQKHCGGESWPEAERKTKAELESVHFNVFVVNGRVMDEDARAEEIKMIAAYKDAACAVRVVRTPGQGGGTVDVWVQDDRSGESVYWQLVADDLEGPDGASILALRIVELIRASLYALQKPDSAEAEMEIPPGAVKVLQNTAGPVEVQVEETVGPAAAGPLANPSKGAFGIRLGFSGIGSPGGTGGRGALDMALRWSFVPFLSVEAEGLFTVVGKDIRHLEAGATFNAALLRAWLIWEILHRGRVRFCAGAGAGGLFAWTQGYAPAESYDVRSELGRAAFLGGSIQIAFVLSRYVWLRAGFAAGTTFPDEIKVRFSGEEVASFGRPLLEGALGVEVHLP